MARRRRRTQYDPDRESFGRIIGAAVLLALLAVVSLFFFDEVAALVRDYILPDPRD